MHVILTVRMGGGQQRDVQLDITPEATIGQVAAALAGGDASTPAVSLRIVDVRTGSSTIPHPMTPADAQWLRSGDVVHVVDLAQLHVTDDWAPEVVAFCRDARGRLWPLREGENVLGRASSAAVPVPDLRVSREHARITIDGPRAWLTDLGSANGLTLDGEPVRGTVRMGDGATLVAAGSVRLTFHRRRLVEPPRLVTPRLTFTPVPQVREHVDEVRVPVPPPPRYEQASTALGWASLAPVPLGLAAYLVTGSPFSLLMVAATPIMAAGVWLEARVRKRRRRRDALRTYRAELDHLCDEVARRQRQHVAVLRRRHPSSAELLVAVRDCDDILWCRGRAHPDALTLRLGRGDRESAVRITADPVPPEDVVVRRWLREVHDRHAVLVDAPVCVSLAELGSVGLVGEEPAVAALARSLVLQLVASHPSEVIALAAIVDPRAPDGWQWMRWLPHVGAAARLLAARTVAGDDAAATRVTRALTELIARRERRRSEGPSPTDDGPVVVVITGVPAGQDNLRTIVRRGAPVGVFVLWCANSRRDLPAEIGAVVHLDAETGTACVDTIETGQRTTVARVETASLVDAAWAARALAEVSPPVVREGGAPRRVTLVGLHPAGVLTSASVLASRWTSAGMRGRDASQHIDSGLWAPLGCGVAGTVGVDLRRDGPHVLVAGTTGSGKSEFLRSWVLSLALRYPPSRLTFLLVDYKGAATFQECARLPHTAGFVSDLSETAAGRLLTSLRAELKRRERLLLAASVASLEELERRDPARAVPSLVIVVDEFAAFIAEVPEFVEEVVDIAARGRSLGIHLILATQRPGGVVGPSVRANTNLRVCLRVADASESHDVLGAAVAANFRADQPGSAAMRYAGGSLVRFQSACTGSAAEVTRGVLPVTVTSLDVPGAADDFPPVSADDAPASPVVVETVREAWRLLGGTPVRQVCLPELPESISVSELSRWSPVGMRGERMPGWALGIRDLPDTQTQEVWAFDPARDRHLLVAGGPGSGKTTSVVSLAQQAVMATSDCVWVFGVSAASLRGLDGIPHYGGTVQPDDLERVGRLVRWLRAAIEDRAGAGRLVPPAWLGVRRAPAQVILVVDPAVDLWDDRGMFLDRDANRCWEVILDRGPAAGVHLVVTADSVRSLPLRWRRAIPRWVLLSGADVPGGHGDPDHARIPGRARVDGSMVQIARPALSPGVHRCAGCGASPAGTAEDSAVRIPALLEEIGLQSLPLRDAAGCPAFARAADTLDVLGVPLRGLVVVQGRRREEIARTVGVMIEAIRRATPRRRVLPVGGPGTLSSPVSAGGAGTGPPGDVPDDDAVVAVPDLAALAARGEIGSWLDDAVTRARSGQGALLLGVDVATLSRQWQAQQALRGVEDGVVLNPRAGDLATLFGCDEPRWPPWRDGPGRGFVVRAGVARCAQVALGSAGPADVCTSER